MRILIVTDAWHPQVNGVVRTLELTIRELQQLGHVVQLCSPDLSRWCTVPLPTYADIRLELCARRRLARLLDTFQPDCIHIATEGPLGWAMRHECLRRDRAFTSAYHTAFPDYAAKRAPLLLRPFVRNLAWWWIRRFHAPSSAVMVATPSIEAELRRKHFHHLRRWGRGVDLELFDPAVPPAAAITALPGPRLLYVGRVAVEKNLLALLALPSQLAAFRGSIIIVGDGPDLETLRAQFPTAHFAGRQTGATLVAYYTACDLFVFPSRTDTFGLVILEALACGLPVAAFPVPGPRDIAAAHADSSQVISLDADLATAVAQALAAAAPRQQCRAYAERFSWRAAAEQFAHNLQAQTPRAVRRIARWRKSLAQWFRGRR